MQKIRKYWSDWSKGKITETPETEIETNQCFYELQCVPVPEKCHKHFSWLLLVPDLSKHGTQRIESGLSIVLSAAFHIISFHICSIGMCQKSQTSLALWPHFQGSAVWFSPEAEILAQARFTSDENGWIDLFRRLGLKNRSVYSWQMITFLPDYSTDNNKVLSFLDFGLTLLCLEPPGNCQIGISKKKHWTMFVSGTKTKLAVGHFWMSLASRSYLYASNERDWWGPCSSLYAPTREDDDVFHTSAWQPESGANHEIPMDWCQWCPTSWELFFSGALHVHRSF